MKSKFDSLFIGVCLGVMVPVLFGYLYYFMQFSKFTFDDYIDRISRPQLLPMVLSLFLVGNLIAFFISIWAKWNMTARGIILATFIYGAIIIILKFT